MADYTVASTKENAAPLITSMDDLKYLRTLNQNSETTRMAIENFRRPSTQINGPVGAITSQVTFEDGFYYINT